MDRCWRRLCEVASYAVEMHPRKNLQSAAVRRSVHKRSQSRPSRQTDCMSVIREETDVVVPEAMDGEPEVPEARNQVTNPLLHSLSTFAPAYSASICYPATLDHSGRRPRRARSWLATHSQSSSFVLLTINSQNSIQVLIIQALLPRSPTNFK